MLMTVPTDIITKGCFNSISNSKEIQPHHSEENANGGKIHLAVDIGDLVKGIKRDVADNDGCHDHESARSDVIHQAAVGAIPSMREITPKKTAITKTINSTFIDGSEVGDVKTRNESNLRRSLTAMGTSENLIDSSIIAQKRLLINELSKRGSDSKNSISSLIAAVKARELSSKTGDNINPKNEVKLGTKKGTLDKFVENNKTKQISNKSADGNKNMLHAIDDKESLRAALAKAIDKVERVVANKNLALIQSLKKPEKSPNLTNVEKTVNAHTKSNSTNITTVEKPTKPPRDPYAEIAMGPDKPKIPELKMEDQSGPIHQVSSESVNLKESKPLGGLHDVGGLLDRLTDKLNMAGGGVAGEQSPVDNSDVKYMQSQLGADDPMNKQDEQMKNIPSEDPIKGMQSEEPMKALQNDLGMKGMQSDDTSKGMSALKDDVDATGDMHKNFDVKQENSEGSEGLVKDILDKASSLNKINPTDANKLGARGGGDEYGGADITPGPYPYEGEHPNTDSYGSVEGSNKNYDMSDILNGGSISNGISNYNSHENQDEGFGDSYDRSGMSDTSRNADSNEEQTPSRSRDKNGDSYLNMAMNTLTTDNEFSTRQNIPESLWSGTRTSEPSSDSYATDSFSNSYNTQMFKKNVILRPQRDYYVSPFHGKDSFEIEM